jgi:hypothetical protein
LSQLLAGPLEQVENGVAGLTVRQEMQGQVS